MLKDTKNTKLTFWDLAEFSAYSANGLNNYVKKKLRVIKSPKGQRKPEFSQTFVGGLCRYFCWNTKTFTKTLSQWSWIRQLLGSGFQAIIHVLPVMAVGGIFCCNWTLAEGDVCLVKRKGNRFTYRAVRRGSAFARVFPAEVKNRNLRGGKSKCQSTEGFHAL